MSNHGDPTPAQRYPSPPAPELPAVRSTAPPGEDEAPGLHPDPENAGSPPEPQAGSLQLSPGEWVFYVHEPGNEDPSRETVRAAVRDLAGQAGPEPGCPVTFRLARPARQLGLAVLHCRHGHAVAYCSPAHMAGTAAAAMTAVAARAASALQGRAVTAIRLTAAGHDELPPPLHPAACYVRGTEVTGAVCTGILTPAMAGALTAVASACLQALGLA